MGVPRFVRWMRERKARRLATSLGIIERLPEYDPNWPEPTQEVWISAMRLAIGLKEDAGT